jgi:DUF1365 family protein
LPDTRNRFRRLHPQSGAPRAYTDRLLAGAGLPKAAARILLLAYPRILGYAFNPISVYFAYDEDDTLIALVYAVRNTFGERHVYVATVEDGDLSEAGIRQTRTKIFHVSPFIDMGTRYNFRILPPGRTVRRRIHETEKGQALLSATRPFSLPLEVSLVDVENRSGNSLGSIEALAERRAVSPEPDTAGAGELPRRGRCFRSR